MTTPTFGLNYLDPRSPVVTDVAPTTTAPEEARVFRSPMPDGARQTGSCRAYILLLDGTSASVRLWVRVRARGGDVWSALGTAPTVLAPNVVSILDDIPASAELFLQVTAAAGAPTLLGVSFC